MKNFSRQDLKDFAESIIRQSDGLSDEELELAAGDCVGVAMTAGSVVLAASLAKVGAVMVWISALS